MIKLILFTALFNIQEPQAIILDNPIVEARKRKSKGRKGRRRGGNGLR